jgi:hypothetical protein
MKDEVRLSFDISASEHAMLKAACAEAMIPMKEFLRDLVLKGVKNLKEDLLTKQKNLDSTELKRM